MAAAASSANGTGKHGWKWRPVGLWTLAVGAFLLLAYMLAVRVATESIAFDDSYNATVAKNLWLGRGYVSSYHELKPFNPEISTGPGMLAPFALFLAATGNRWWAPGVFSAGLNFVFVLLIAFLARRLWDSTERFLCFLLVLLALLWVFSGVDAWFTLWYQLVGDVPSGLLAAAGSILAFQGEGRKRMAAAAAAGLLFGWAFVIKTITLFCFAAGLLVMCAAAVAVRPLRLRNAIPPVLLSAGFAAPWAAYQAIQRIALGAHGFARLKEGEAAFFAVAGSGLSQLRHSADPLAAVQANAAQSWETYTAYFGPPWAVFALISLSLVALWFAAGPRGRRPGPAAALLLAAGLHASWWLTMGSLHTIRHLAPALVYLSAGLAIVVAGLRPKTAALLLAGLALACGPRALRWRPDFPSPFEPSPRVRALTATAEFLKRERLTGRLAGAGWWSNPDLEFVLPRVLNFRDYLLLDPSEQKRSVLVMSDYWNWEKDPRLTRLADSCKWRLLFQREPFSVCAVSLESAAPQQAPPPAR